MNAQELFWGNKRVAKILQGALLDFFRKRTGADVEGAEPEFFEAKDEAPAIHTHFLIRYNTKKESFPIAFGSGGPGFAEIFHGAFSPNQADGKPFDPRAMEKEMIQAIVTVLDPELKAHQVIVDPKNIYPVQGKTLGGWSEIAYPKVLKLSFRFANGRDFAFEIPLIDSNFHRKKSLDLFALPLESRILVVDDSATTRKLSRHYFSIMGFQNIEECVDGQAALTKLVSSNPRFNLVVADWHMPNLSGIELLRAIRADAELKALPVILATGERNAAEVTSAVKAGVSGYVVKPFEAETLLAAVRKVFGGSAATGTATPKVA